MGVDHLPATVSPIDTDGQQVITDDGRTRGYDRLILAAGSQLVRPDLPGAERLFDIDTLAAAERLDAHLRDRPDFHAIVVGAGFTGLATRTRRSGIPISTAYNLTCPAK
ncbi:FAD-dependent oxidoreductase [Nocardia sp. NPDC050406]|uniref:FAD-dependent oxidoreductase n=1 Tax=Nocardia sp. NPDC050406 TaxID=3364318 RepID=UPI0037B2F2DA